MSVLCLLLRAATSAHGPLATLSALNNEQGSTRSKRAKPYSSPLPCSAQHSAHSWCQGHDAPAML